MARQYRSPVMASIHETAKGLHAAGVMDKQAMRRFDGACLTPVRPLPPADMRALREREGTSQVVVTGQLHDRIVRRIAKGEGAVFFRSDFRELGNPGQVGRALRALMKEGRLIRFGHGIYVRARPSSIDGQPVPAKSMRDLAAEALARLGAEVTESRAERAYNSGRSEQVPTGRVIGVRGKRVRRKLGCNGVALKLERLGRERPPRRPKRPTGPPPEPITLRDALRGIWQADKYPVLGNEDLREARRLDAEALERAGWAVMSPGDRPEFADWIAALRNPELPGDEREEIMYAVHDLFEPDES